MMIKKEATCVRQLVQKKAKVIKVFCFYFPVSKLGTGVMQMKHAWTTFLFLHAHLMHQVPHALPFSSLCFTSIYPFHALLSLISKQLARLRNHCASSVAVHLQFTAITSLYLAGCLFCAGTTRVSLKALRRRKKTVLVGGRKRQGQSRSRFSHRLLRRRTKHTQSDPIEAPQNLS